MDVVIFQDSQAVLASVQKEVQRLEMELDSSNREKVSIFEFLCFECSSQFSTNHVSVRSQDFLKKLFNNKLYVCEVTVFIVVGIVTLIK